VVRADIDLTWALAFVAATVDLNLEQNRFVVDHDGTHVAVFEPARFRPSVLVGIEGRIMGGELQ